MTDPAVSLKAFQEALLAGEIKLTRGVLDPDLYSYKDYLDEKTPRHTLVRLDGQIVTALVIFGRCSCGHVNGKPCFCIGYAVPEEYRNQKRAKEIVRAALAQLQYEAKQNGVPVFYVEAIIDVENKFSQRVAAQTISNAPVRMTDALSDKPALRYLRKVEAKERLK